MNFLVVSHVSMTPPPVAPASTKTEEPVAYDVDEFKRLLEATPTPASIRFNDFTDELLPMVRRSHHLPYDRLEQGIRHLLCAHGLEEECHVNLIRTQDGYDVRFNAVIDNPPPRPSTT